MRTVRIGNGCGFWGDQPKAPYYLVRDGQLDYLTLEYLAELTMSILAVQRHKDPARGYATDVLEVLESLVPLWVQQPQLKIVTNAGGLNPQGCAQKIRHLLHEHGLAERRIAVVSGDDLMPQLDALLAAKCSLAHLDTHEPLEKVRSQVVCANAYLGAGPIVEALRQGADLVVTGRVADASLTVAPAVYELGWQWTDWHLLAAATVAGHLIECGAQVTGGLWCNWREAPDLANVGYPFADIAADGTVVIGKPAGSGGRVCFETVSEQLLYEVDDPSHYLTPDVIADFTSVRLQEVAQDVVQLTGARGFPATDSYKVSIAYRAGWTASGTVTVFGADAVDKARACADIVRHRLARAGCRFDVFHAELLGAGAVVPGVVSVPVAPAEVVLRLTVQSTDRASVERFSRELAPLVTSGPPGVTGYVGGRPPVRELFVYWPALIPKHLVQPRVVLLS